MGRLWTAVRSIIYATLFLIPWAWVALKSRALDKRIPLRIPPGLALPGLVLGMAGAALAVATVGFFIFEGRGTPAVFDPPRKFVPQGPFRFIRNPMYVGGVTTLTGWGLYARSVSMVLFAIVVFLLCHTFVVFVEEPGLRKRFGQEYEAYCGSVGRWLPRLAHRNPAG